MKKRLFNDLLIVSGMIILFLTAQLLSNYIHYGTFIFK